MISSNTDAPTYPGGTNKARGSWRQMLEHSRVVSTCQIPAAAVPSYLLWRIKECLCYDTLNTPLRYALSTAHPLKWWRGGRRWLSWINISLTVESAVSLDYLFPLLPPAYTSSFLYSYPCNPDIRKIGLHKSSQGLRLPTYKMKVLRTGFIF